MNNFKPNFIATAVGSMPHKDALSACHFIKSNFDDMPFWPQLSKLGFTENMYVQYSEGFEAFTIDKENKRIYLDRSKDVNASIEKLYEHFIAGDLEYFGISKDFSAGLYALSDMFKDDKSAGKFIKGQIIGPVSFGLSVTDDSRRALAYDNEVMSALVKLLVMKSRWQIKKLSRGRRVIISLDEPYLASIGSAYTAVKKEDMSGWFDEIIDAIHAENALAAIHCCGNTDWPLLLNTKVDMISFDAYNYSEEISLYPGEIKDFLLKSGVLAWGIVPTTAEEIGKEDSIGITKRLKNALGLLEAKGIDRGILISQGIVTPSCGTGLLSEELAEKAHIIACDVSKAMRRA